MPISTGRPEAGSSPSATTRRFSASKLAPLDQRPGQELRRARLDHRDALEHLPDDHLDVLVVDRDALAAVDLLDLAHQVQLHLARAHDPQHVVRVRRAPGEPSCWPASTCSRPSLPPAGEPRRVIGYSHDLLAAVVRRDDDASRGALGAVGLLDPHPPGRLGDRRDALGDTRLEQLRRHAADPCVMSSPATPPVWNVRIVSCVPGSPIDCAAMMPTASPTSTSLPVASERP